MAIMATKKKTKKKKKKEVEEETFKNNYLFRMTNIILQLFISKQIFCIYNKISFKLFDNLFYSYIFA